MNRRGKIVVSVTGIFLVLLILIGLTYGYFLTRINGNPNDSSISVTTANLELTYTDGNGILTPANTLIPNTDVAFLDGNGNVQTQKTFTVTNKGNDTEYIVFIDNINVTYAKTKGTQIAGESTSFESNDFRFTLTCTITSSDSSRNNKPCEGVIDGTFPLTDNSILVGNDILKGDVHNYTLTMKYIESYKNQTNDKNKTLSAKINIEDIHRLNPYSDNENSLAYNIINNALNKANGTELMATPPTKVAEQISGINEKVLSTTIDDYGTSYYFRGDVQDNFVNFAGMCWRIVRIAGDGSTKLILQDKEHECDNASYTGTGHIGYYNYGYEKNPKLNAVTASYNDYIYTTNYLNPTYNKESSMVKALYDFQTTKLADYIDKLKSGDWCLADKAYSRTGSSNADYTYTLLNDTQKQNNKVEGVEFYYDSYVRLSGENKDGYSPTLKCNGTLLNEFEETDVTTKLPMYASTITADEIIYAGGKLNEYSFKYYLKGNYDYWTLSPSSFTISNGAIGDSIIRVRDTSVDNKVQPVFVDSLTSLRISVSLSSGAEITEGNGTQSNPYVIG